MIYSQKHFKGEMGDKISFELSDDLLSILDLEFDGEYHRSENSRFILGWSQSYFNVGLYFLGNFVLLDRDRIILFEDMQIPHDGKVSNEGVFIINDWMIGKGVKETFYAIGADGKVLIDKKIDANLGMNGLSNDGKFAVCQTNKGENEDSNKLFFFDIEKQELKWSCVQDSCYAESFRFDTENRVLFLNYNYGKYLRFNFDGQLLDIAK